jgi:hypothetical protein
MEPEGSLPSSQELSTCTYPEPDQSSQQHPIPPYLEYSYNKMLYTSCYIPCRLIIIKLIITINHYRYNMGSEVVVSLLRKASQPLVGADLIPPTTYPTPNPAVPWSATWSLTLCGRQCLFFIGSETSSPQRLFPINKVALKIYLAPPAMLRVRAPQK